MEGGKKEGEKEERGEGGRKKRRKEGKGEGNLLGSVTEKPSWSPKHQGCFHCSVHLFAFLFLSISSILRQAVP